jgi:nitrite reductase/ring-hydroxylating ferredoxin subunit
MAGTDTNSRDIGSTSDFPNGELRILDVAGVEVAVIRWTDVLYAVRNICPHIGGPVCGSVGPPSGWDEVSGTPVMLPGRLAVRCAWHRWEYDMHSGESLSGDKSRIRTYGVRDTANGRVVLDMSRPGRGQAAG